MVSASGQETPEKIEVQQLITDFNSKDIRVHEKAHLALLTLGDKAIPPLVQALDSRDRWIRWEAAKTLAEMRDPELAPVLTRELEHKDPDVRWVAAEGLLALGKDGLPSLLEALIKDPTSMWLIEGAHHILSDLYKKRLHEGEDKYASLYEMDDALRQKIKPVLLALEETEPSHTLPAFAKSALDYLKSTGS